MITSPAARLAYERRRRNRQINRVPREDPAEDLLRFRPGHFPLQNLLNVVRQGLAPSPGHVSPTPYANRPARF